MKNKSRITVNVLKDSIQKAEMKVIVSAFYHKVLG